MNLLREYVAAGRLFGRNAWCFLTATFLLGGAMQLFFAYRNLFLRSVGYDYLQVGGVLAGTALGMAIVALPAALQLDRGRSRPVLVCAALLSAGGFFGQALLPHVWQVVVAGMVSGVGFAVVMIAAPPFFMRNTSPRERGHLFGMSMAAGTLGGVCMNLSTVAVGKLLQGGQDAAARAATEPAVLADPATAQMRWFLLTGAVLGLLAAVCFLLVRETESADPVTHRSLWHHLASLPWRLVGKACAPNFLIGMGAGLTIPFMNLYFPGRFGADHLTVGLIMTASAATNMLGFLDAPVLAHRFGSVRTVVVTQLLSIPFFLLVAFTFSPALAAFGFLARAALMNMNQPVMSRFILELVPDHQTGVVNAMRRMSWNLAWVVSTLGGGWLLEQGPRWTGPLLPDIFTMPMLVTAGVYTLAAVVVWLFFRDVSEPRPEPVRGTVTAGA